MKILVTGSEGFIGGYIVQELLDKGYQVIGVDNLSKYGNLTRSFGSNPNYNLVKGDVQNFELMLDLMSDVDHVIAGAALIGGISYFHTYAYDLLAQNERIIASTCDAAIAVRKNGGPLKKVTYLSSSMVYESANSWPSVEGDEQKMPPPRSSYGFQKLSVEYFARAAWYQYKLPYTIVRPFNCVGIGERRALGDVEITAGNISLAMSHVVPDIIQKILKGQNPVHILGDGNQVRHYTYGADLARGIVLAMLSDKSLNEDFNLSTTESTTVLELTRAIWEKINPGLPLRVVHDKGFEFDVARRIPNVSKAKNLLQFEATTNLDQMLDIVIPWVQDAIDNNLI